MGDPSFGVPPTRAPPWRVVVLLGFAGATEAQVEIESNWLETEGVSSLNYRAAIDPLGNAYILGRAFTAEEEALVLADARKADGIKNVVDYVEVRAKES